MSKFSALELEVDKVNRMSIVHPTTRQPLRDKDGKDAYIDHYSADSEVVRKVQRALSRRRLNAGRTKITPEEIEADGVETLAALTAGWYLVDLSGNPIDVPFSQENAREIYANPAVRWLREQLDDSSVDRANFARAQ